MVKRKIDRLFAIRAKRLLYVLKDKRRLSASFRPLDAYQSVPPLYSTEKVTSEIKRNLVYQAT